MSEYQYYEFRAIDRPLKPKEMEALRDLSTRAEITPTSFTNTYNYGDFRGDPEALVGRYFDAFVYVANWGTHRLMFRIPKDLLDVKAAEAYRVEEGLSVKSKKAHVVLEFLSDEEGGDGWIEGEPWMPGEISLRDDLMRGDFRALYLGWLASIQYGEVGDDPREEARLEPPVPPGLAKLTEPLRELADFLRLDDDLLEAAVAGSVGEPPAAPSRDEMGRWIKKLPVAEKDAYLLRFLAEDGDLLLRAELSKRFRESSVSAGRFPAPNEERRTVRQLLEARDLITEEKNLKAAEKAARQRARAEREKEMARAMHLDKLAGGIPEAWREVDKLIASTQPKAYDRAVSLLVDLRDLAERTGRTADTQARILELRRLHSRKLQLMKRFDSKKLGT